MLMISRTAVVTKGGAAGSTGSPLAFRISFPWLLVLSAWCGLVAGLFEVGTSVLRKQVFDADRFHEVSRHFVWLVPLVNLSVFLAVGLLASGVSLVWPRHGRWLFTRVLCALVFLPSFLAAFPRIYSLAWFVVALGVAARLVPVIEAMSGGFRRFVLVSLPAAIAIVAIMGASDWAADQWKQARESARSSPPPGSPNVLLIVMDTVAAAHLSLHGYERATSTTLIELAGRGARFDSARASSSWTLPSHASMFTGRWLHELSVGWYTPLDGARPTLAEFLGDRGYATAGFVANTYYCAADTGLARGFTQYQDFIFPELTALKTATLVSRALEGLRTAVYFSGNWLEYAGLLPSVRRLVRALDDDRKGAAAVNREFLDWLSRRAAPERPFFAFLNYYDAHFPYELPPGRLHRFGAEPADDYQRLLIQQWGLLDKTTVSPAGVGFAVASYDDCIADLDEQIGKLVDELDRRGVLERTLLIVTSDHGESFGEHAGVFCHGTSLYDTELHVPLIVVPPGGSAAGRLIKESVSLRELAATIVDITGQEAGAPFPGVSLARFWKHPGPVAPVQPFASPSLAEVIPLHPRMGDYWGTAQQFSPLGAVKNSEWSYIRREGDTREELFHLSVDANEQRNLADDPSAQAALEQMRGSLDHLTGGPLLPERFSH
jgi:arylsulfatase A-like enzyme